MSQQAQLAVQTQQKATDISSFKGNMLQRAAINTPITPVHSGILQRCSGGVECAACRQKRLEKEGTLQRAAVNSAPTNDVPPIVHNVLSSSGQLLDAGTRAFMEPRFGHDFSNVRVHTDARAAESARVVNALAYTVGRDVVFGRGQYMPGTMEGMRLMAHELTHVVQQGVRNSSLQEKLVVGQPDDPYEQEAEAQAANVIEGRGVDTVSIQGQPGIARLQRKIDPVKELTGTGCEPPTTSPAGPLLARVHFGFDKDHVSAKEEAEIDMFVTGSGGGSGLSIVRVDGYASTVGDERYNLHLSCRRAKAVRKELAKKLHMLSEASIATFAHGETSEWSDKKLKKGPEENQIVIISATSVPSRNDDNKDHQDVCQPKYDTSYSPSSTDCSRYNSPSARRWLTYTYRHNSTCACENTPNNPKNNCVRKCLQTKMFSFLSGLSPSGAVIGSCIDPFGILDFVCPEPFCSTIYDHHVDCYKECCCNDPFINYPIFLTMCEAPFPCSFVGTTIDWFNSCT